MWVHILLDDAVVARNIPIVVMIVVVVIMIMMRLLRWHCRSTFEGSGDDDRIPLIIFERKNCGSPSGIKTA